ncbi:MULTISPECIES: AAA family ATPase [Pseudomonas]|nr:MULTISPECIES: AAA family ATPase [Pseudomonas]NRH44611.1 hypothetical protein [Pseudomonas sp. MS15a(2019)]
MIRSFLHERREIKLHRSKTINLGRDSLYQANSMTLLVGPNGSGKTACLFSLMNQILSGDRKAHDSVAFDHPEEKYKTCIIYYTPVPYLRETPVSDPHLKMLVPRPSKLAKSLTDTETRIAEELKQEFKINILSYLKLDPITDRDIENLLTLIARRRFIQDSLFVEIQNEYDYLEHVHLELRETKATYDSPEFLNLRSKQEHLRSKFLTTYKALAGDDYAIRLRAYVSAKRSCKASLGGDLQLLEDLGFTISINRIKNISQRRTKSRTAFRSAIGTLRHVSRILRDRTLENDLHEINHSQHALLHHIDISRVGFTKFNQLSSGAAALFDQFASITQAVADLAPNPKNEHLLLLIDEGDAFLHLKWQQHYINYLDKTIANIKLWFKTVQVIVTTHSPVLMSDFPREFVVNLEDKDSIKRIMDIPQDSDQPTFGAPVETVMREIANAGTIGSFTAKIIRELIDRIRNGEEVSPSQISVIGDPALRKQLMAMLNEQIRKD